MLAGSLLTGARAWDKTLVLHCWFYILTGCRAALDLLGPFNQLSAFILN